MERQKGQKRKKWQKCRDDPLGRLDDTWFEIRRRAIRASLRSLRTKKTEMTRSTLFLLFLTPDSVWPRVERELDDHLSSPPITRRIHPTSPLRAMRGYSGGVTGLTEP